MSSYNQEARIRETEMLALAIYFAASLYEGVTIDSDPPLDINKIADTVIALLPFPVCDLQRTCAIARAKQRLGMTTEGKS